MPFLSFLKRYPLLTLLAGIVLLKLGILVITYVSFNHAAHPDHALTALWHRWDARAYEAIATSGYNSPELALDYRRFIVHFPPLYPALLQAASSLPGLTIPRAGMAISFSSGIAASALLYELVRRDLKSRRIAVGSVLLLNAHPTAYFMLAPYTESVFLLLIIAGFYFIRVQPNARQWAGLAGGLAVTTRLLGALLLPAFLVTAIRSFREGKHSWKDLILMGGPVIAVLGYLLLNVVYYQDPFFFREEYRTNPYSNKVMTVPFQETATLLRQMAADTSLLATPGFMMNHGWNAIITTATVLILLVGIRLRLPLEYYVFGLAYTTFFASFHWGISNARYSLAVFPVAIILAHIRSRWLLGALLILLALFQIRFAIVFTSGAWAF